MTKAKNDGYRIIYIDETMFTRKTVADAEWSRPKENMAVDVARLEEPTLALLCGISKEKGLEHFRIFEQSVNVDKFLDYLKGLKEALPFTIYQINQYTNAKSLPSCVPYVQAQVGRTIDQCLTLKPLSIGEGRPPDSSFYQSG